MRGSAATAPERHSQGDRTRLACRRCPGCRRLRRQSRRRCRSNPRQCLLRHRPCRSPRGLRPARCPRPRCRPLQWRPRRSAQAFRRRLPLRARACLEPLLARRCPALPAPPLACPRIPVRRDASRRLRLPSAAVRPPCPRRSRACRALPRTCRRRCRPCLRRRRVGIRSRICRRGRPLQHTAGPSILRCPGSRQRRPCPHRCLPPCPRRLLPPRQAASPAVS